MKVEDVIVGEYIRNLKNGQKYEVMDLDQHSLFPYVTVVLLKNANSNQHLTLELCDENLTHFNSSN